MLLFNPIFIFVLFFLLRLSLRGLGKPEVTLLGFAQFFQFLDSCMSFV